MPKPPNLIPSKQLNVALPLPLFTRLSLELNSDLEGRVPHGAYSRFLAELIRGHFEEEHFDFGHLIDETIPAGHFVVHGAKEAIEALRRKFS